MRRDKIGINIASLAPRAAFDLEWAVGIAEKAGFGWVSLLPLWSCQKPRELSLPVRFAENAWNSGDVFDFWRGIRGDPTAPKLQDLALFPHSAKFCNDVFQSWLDFDRRTRPVVHSWDRVIELVQQGYSPLFEVSPGLWQSAGEIAIKLEQKLLAGERRIVLDLAHIRRKPRADEMAKNLGAEYAHTGWKGMSPLGPWRKTVRELLPYTGLVDFQTTDPKELLETLDGENTELRRMVTFIRDQGYEGPWRVEINLGILGQLRFGYLVEVLAATRNWLATATAR